MIMKTDNFGIVNNQLHYLREGHPAIVWGRVNCETYLDGGIRHSYTPVPFQLDECNDHGCGVLTAERCLEIAALLKMMDVQVASGSINNPEIPDSSNRDDFIPLAYVG